MFAWNYGVDPPDVYRPALLRRLSYNYRWRLGLAEGEPLYEELEGRLAQSPAIGVPTITLEGDANGAPHPEPSAYAGKFTGTYAHRLIEGSVFEAEDLVMCAEAQAGIETGANQVMTFGRLESPVLWFHRAIAERWGQDRCP